MSRARSMQVLALAAALTATIGCDQATKRLARGALAGVPGRSYLADTFRLEYAENPGAFLSLGAGWPRWARARALPGASLLALLGTAVAAIRHRWPYRVLLGLSLVWAGGVSNLVDRLADGKVVDFMNLGLGSLRTGIFNVADLAIMAGAALAVFGASRTEGPAACTRQPEAPRDRR